jgi:hypothetical protein
MYFALLGEKNMLFVFLLVQLTTLKDKTKKNPNVDDLVSISLAQSKSKYA